MCERRGPVLSAWRGERASRLSGVRLAEALVIYGAGTERAGVWCPAPSQTGGSLVLELGAIKLRVDANFDEVVLALPDRPKDRYLELSPKHWRATRGNVLTSNLESPLCAFTVRPAALNFAR